MGVLGLNNVREPDRGSVLHRNNFDLLRLVMAGAVVFSHSFALLGIEQPSLLETDLGTRAVQVFFAMSGYMISLSWMRVPHLGSFALRRALRLLPALALAIGFGKLAIYLGGGFQNSALPGDVNGSLWTIPWELTCYAACALAGLLGLLRPDRFRLFFATCWIAALVNVSDDGGLLERVPLMLLFFLTGGFIAVYEGEMNVRRLGQIGAAVLAVAMVWPWLMPAYILVKVQAYLVPPVIFKMAGQIGLTLAMSFTTIYFGRYVRTVLPLRHDVSYGLYVFAWPVQQLAISWGAGPNPWILFLASLGGALPLAVLSWFLVERPALRLKQPRRPRVDPLLAERKSRWRLMDRQEWSLPAGESWPGWLISLPEHYGYLAGFVTLCAAVAVRLVLGDALQGFPFVTFFPAVLVTAVAGGWRPAWIFAFFELGIAYGCFATPAAGWPLADDRTFWIGLGMDVVTVGSEIGIVTLLRSALREALMRTARPPQALPADMG